MEYGAQLTLALSFQRVIEKISKKSGNIMSAEKHS